MLPADAFEAEPVLSPPRCIGYERPIHDTNAREITMKVHGSCHCENIRYEAVVDPELTSICHCTDCQKLSATAYRVTARAIEGSFRLLRGEPAIYVKIGSSGARRAQAFCPNCGSQLYVTDADRPGIYGLRVGCIDERVALVPRRQVWCRSALPWTDRLDSIERRETT